MCERGETHPSPWKIGGEGQLRTLIGSYDGLERHETGCHNLDCFQICVRVIYFNIQAVYFNKKSKDRDLVPGDKVLLLLPQGMNKLEITWQGPFFVVDNLSCTNYRIFIKGKQKIKPHESVSEASWASSRSAGTPTGYGYRHRGRRRRRCLGRIPPVTLRNLQVCCA